MGGRSWYVQSLWATSAILALLVAGGCERPDIDNGDGPGSGSDVTSDTTSPPVSYAPGCGDFDFQTAQTFETDERVEIILSSMSLTQKVNQMSGPPGPSSEIFITSDDAQANVRGFKFRDGPRGVRTESDTATCFPVSVARGASWDLDLEERIGEATGLEVRGLGHNTILAPCINTLRHPGWGRAQETYGEDPWFLGKMGAAYTLGAQRQVPACIKHYAGNNIEDTRMTNNAVIDEQALRENYTRQFRMAIEEADAACVMSAYNKVNGQYCSENNHLLKEVLKGEWGFDGFVVSDWFAAQSTVESAVAGLDLEMPWRTQYDGLELAVTSGQVPESVIDDAVRRILRTKFKFGFGLIDEPYDGDPEVVESEAHRALALEAAQKGSVLLRNGAGVLPLDRATVGKIAVVGEWSDQARLGDNGSSHVETSYAITPYQGIAARAGDGVEVVQSKNATAAEGADVAIVIAALTQQDEGEAWNGGGDRDHLRLSPIDEALINQVAAMVDKTVVIMEAGGPITMDAWGENVHTLVMAWYPGMEGGHALGDLLFGDVNFSGRVVQTWPVSLDQAPHFGNHQSETEYDYFHGYRHFDKEGTEPLFPFGYGLSYTTFALSNLVVPCETITPAGRLVVTVDVENTGDRAGVEVVQLYVGYPHTTARRPARELKAFARVELAAGEKKTVELPVLMRDIAYWDTGADGWVVEPVTHLIEVGSHARDLPLTGEFTVADVGQSVSGTTPGPTDVTDTSPPPGPADVAEETGPVPSGKAKITFQVDMTGFDPQYLWASHGGVYLQGEFNDWCGGCNPIFDDDGDNIWSWTMEMDPGSYQYKYTTSVWNGLHEMVPAACDPHPDDEWHNRGLVVGAEDQVLPVHYFDRCPDDGGPVPQAVDVTFQLDQAGLDTTGDVYLQGIFNGWCGHCNPLMAPDSEGIWRVTIPLLPRSYEYKYTTNGWDGLEEIVSQQCDGYPGDEFFNRFLLVPEGVTSLVIPAHTWEQCP